MAIDVTTYTALPKPPAGQTPWFEYYHAMVDRVDAYKVARNFAVRATNHDDEGVPTGLAFTVAEGDFVGRGNFGMDGAFATAGPFASTATASTTTYVWITAGGTLGKSASGYPFDEAHIRLARVVANAADITAIHDDRYPQFYIQGGEIGGYYRPGGVSSYPSGGDQSVSFSSASGTEVRLVLVDASAGPATITVPAPTGALLGATLVLKKTDASANAVRLAVAGGGTIDGQATQSITTQYGVLRAFCAGILGNWHLI